MLLMVVRKSVVRCEHIYFDRNFLLLYYPKQKQAIRFQQNVNLVKSAKHNSFSFFRHNNTSLMSLFRILV